MYMNIFIVFKLQFYKLHYITYLSKEVDIILDVYKSICCTLVQEEVNLSSLHHKEEKDMTQLFHIDIHIMKTKVDALLDSTSQYNFIEAH